MHIHQYKNWNDIIFYWYQSYHWYQLTIEIALYQLDHKENNLSPFNEMHIHQQNHWNDIIFYWYQSYHWYQWTIGIALYPARSNKKII